jgi:hypothetical protein
LLDNLGHWARARPDFPELFSGETETTGLYAD